MGISFDRTAYKGTLPVFWRGECKVLPGDYRLRQEFPEGTLLPKGTPIAIDFDNMECAVIKLAKVIAGGTRTIPRVTKGTLLQKGDTVMKLGESGKSVTVSAIDTSNESYDEITLSESLTDLAEGDFIQESTKYEASKADKPEVPARPLYETGECVIEETHEYSKKGFQTVSAGYQACILKAVAYPVPDSWLEGSMSLKTNHSIKYIKQ